MKRNKVSLTEKQLHRVIKESVSRVLRELEEKPLMFSNLKNFFKNHAFELVNDGGMPMFRKTIWDDNGEIRIEVDIYPFEEGVYKKIYSVNIKHGYSSGYGCLDDYEESGDLTSTYEIKLYLKDNDLLRSE